jgi:hypothetical protein
MRSVLLAAAIGGLAVTATAQEVYVTANVDDRGRLHITTAQGRLITIPAEQVTWEEKEAVSFDDVAIAPDGTAVGWIASFEIGQKPLGATRRPTPLKVVVYKNGRLRTFAEHLPVWKWAFLNNGTQVGFEQMQLHGSNDLVYELREMSTGRRLARYIVNILEEPTHVPSWVKVVASQPQ